MGKQKNIPKHVGIILDGNGRWARGKGLLRNDGHEAGMKNAEELLPFLFTQGVEAVTIFAFSTENWSRAEEEVDGLFDLFRQAMRDAAPRLQEKKIHIRFIGDRSALSEDLQQGMDQVERESACIKDPLGTLVVAINYGGWDEVRRGCERMIHQFTDLAVHDVATRFLGPHPADVVAWEIQKAMRNLASSIQKDTISRCLDTVGLPDVDLVIRTAGEKRLSGFLPLQAAYAEYYWIDKPWPAVTKRDLLRAIRAFGRRNRSFGGAGQGN